MVATVVPRPIAWVVTKDAAGVTNAAPYSLFTMFSDGLPFLAFGKGPSPRAGTREDTARNVLETKRFTICMVPESAAERMNITATDFAPGVDELAIAHALAEAAPADVVLIAGKGHEDYQEAAGVRRPFSDVVEARAALRRRQEARE